MQSEFPHPTTVSIPKDEIAQKFVQFTPGTSISPFWQFKLLIEKSFRVGPQAVEPTPGGDLTTLAIFNRENPSCDLEILAQHLAIEIDPANWLELWLHQRQITPISVKRLSTLSGEVGDVIGSWTTDGVQWIGRFFCMKAGPRMALLCFRAPATEYTRLADDIFLSIATFSFVDNSPGPLAEKVRWVNNTQPVNWRLVVPSSWEISPEPASPEVASFQANLILRDASRTILQGKLSFAVARADQAADYQSVLANALEAIREAGVKLESEHVAAENVSPPFTGSWIALARADIGGQAGELRCRILQHPLAWVVAAVISVDVASSPVAWMRTMRLLSIVTSTIEIG